MKLSNTEKTKFARIIYSSGTGARRRKQIDGLNDDQLQLLRSIYAQKIVYETAHGDLPVLEGDRAVRAREEPPVQESLFANIFWCFYPENNRQYYNVSSTLFLKRALYPLLFWKEGFFEIDEDNIEHYGQTWMVLTYAVALFLAATLTNFYVDPVQFKQDFEVVGKCLFIVYVFKNVQPILHAAAIECLGSQITVDECMMLSGYSLALYLLPTIACMAPSIYWRVLMLALGGILRVIFLFRNYSTKAEARRIFLLILLVFIEIFYAVIVYRSLFLNYALGYGFYEAYAAVFGQTPSDTQSVGSSAPNETGSALSHTLFGIPSRGLRRFEV